MAYPESNYNRPDTKLTLAWNPPRHRNSIETTSSPTNDVNRRPPTKTHLGQHALICCDGQSL
eukprot:7645912-Alexandrium_andersonii.AAC.1